MRTTIYYMHHKAKDFSFDDFMKRRGNTTLLTCFTLLTLITLLYLKTNRIWF